MIDRLCVLRRPPGDPHHDGDRLSPDSQPA
jgi:hypothetical protein